MSNDRPVPQRVLIAPDKFKGTMTAAQAAAAIERGLRRAWPGTQFTTVPLADGGEGFAECLVQARGGRMHSMQTVDASNRPCIAEWGELEPGTAALDIASASGLAHIPNALRNPALASTYGTGLVVREILRLGFGRIIVGLGGSATNDAGIGLLGALGFRFFDASGCEAQLNGAGLASIARIESPDDSLPCRFVIATDVINPLFGPNGAAHRFAAQKGASPAMIAELDQGLRCFAGVVARHVGHDLADRPGAGAAGGVGFGMMALLHAEQRSGFELVREQLKLDQLCNAHDLIVTGEGCFDETSLSGKAPVRMAQLARDTHRQVWGLFGRCEYEGVDEVFARHGTLATTQGVSSDLALNQQRLADGAFELASRRS